MVGSAGQVNGSGSWFWGSSQAGAAAKTEADTTTTSLRFKDASWFRSSVPAGTEVRVETDGHTRFGVQNGPQSNVFYASQPGSTTGMPSRVFLNAQGTITKSTNLDDAQGGMTAPVKHERQYTDSKIQAFVDGQPIAQTAFAPYTGADHPRGAGRLSQLELVLSKGQDGKVEGEFKTHVDYTTADCMSDTREKVGTCASRTFETVVVRPGTAIVGSFMAPRTTFNAGVQSLRAGIARGIGATIEEPGKKDN